MILRTLCLSLICLAQPLCAQEGRLIGVLGQDTSSKSAEVQLRYLAPPAVWKLQPLFGLSVSENGSGWAGLGSGLTWGADKAGPFLRVSFMAGLYRAGSGPDLGGALQFRSALDLGYLANNNMEYGVGVDHRSNAGLNRRNPGLDTAYLFVTVALP